MIIVRLIGGLGNQMFQYALGRHLAIINNTTLKLDISGFKNYPLRSYGLNNFNIEENFAKSDDLKIINSHIYGWKRGIMQALKVPKKIPNKIKYIKQQSFDFQPEILSLGDDLYLDGSWQSEKYFLKIKDVIKKDFTIKGNLSYQTKKYLNIIKNCEAVSIHIRRGDYISNVTTNKFHGSLTIMYYQKAMSILSEKGFSPHFFVFSDDLEWAIRNLKSDFPITYVKSNDLKSSEDLHLMSFCKHHIIANSSFSWWGAWLGNYHNKIIIGPSKWFREIEYEDEDRMPKSWIRI